jgi:hypothetical protein
MVWVRLGAQGTSHEDKVFVDRSRQGAQCGCQAGAQTEQSLRKAVVLLRNRTEGIRAVSADPAALWSKNGGF